MTRVLCAMIACAVALTPTCALAWGEEGHRVVAGIAERYLERHAPRALERARRMLGGASLGDKSLYADEVRDERSYTKRWHYVDVPVRADRYEPARDCQSTPKGDCSVQAFYRFNDVLANEREPECVRAEALAWMLHLVADLHQPLHATDDGDGGGNRKKVSFFGLRGYNGDTPNLHQVWDTGIIRHSRRSVRELVDELGTHEEPRLDMRVLTWVAEAHRLGQEAYRRLPPPERGVYRLDRDDRYYDEGLRAVKQQLRKAGIRLAKVIERALD